MVKMSRGIESAIVANVTSIILHSEVMDLLAGGPTSSDYSIFTSACLDMSRIVLIILK